MYRQDSTISITANLQEVSVFVQKDMVELIAPY